MGRGRWSLEQTARVFLLTAATVASWVRRVDEGRPNAPVRLIEPVNKFPDFVRYIVQRLRALCPMLAKWCDRRNIKPRFGAVGQHGSIAVIERLILTLKQSIRWLPLVPFQRAAFLRELQLLAAWYNAHRPHMSLADRTPDEVYHDLRPANRPPRFEPRTRWPRSSSCARPVALVKGQPGVRIEMEVEFLAARKHLPLVHLKRAA